MVNGIAQRPIEGMSMTYTFDKANANAPSTRTTQYFEMFGNRAIYHDGWIAATTPPAGALADGHGQYAERGQRLQMGALQHRRGLSENNDLAAKMPDKLRNMQELFLVEAAKYKVLPLDNRCSLRALAPRPSPTAGKTVFTYSGEVSGTPESSAPSTLDKSFSISAEVEIPQGGAEGMLNTIGGRFGGYGLYLVKGKPVFTYVQLTTERFRWESPEALAPGKHTIVFDFKQYDGPGFGKGGTGVLSVDGRQVDSKTMPTPFRFIVSYGRVVRRRRGHAHGRRRQRLSSAVPVHRQAGQADRQAGSAADDGRGRGRTQEANAGAINGRH